MLKRHRLISDTNVGIDRLEVLQGFEQTVDEIVAYAYHNGWQGMTWTKGEDSRRVEGVPAK